MSKWQEYYDEAMDFAAPYVHRAGERVEAAARGAERAYRRGRRKAKNHRRLLRFQRGLELVKNLILIAAAIIALFGVIRKYFLVDGE